MQTSVTSCRPPFRTVTRSSRHRTPDEVVALRTYVPGRRSSENEPSLLAEAIEGRHTCRSAFDLSCRIGTLGHVEESHAELNGSHPSRTRATFRLNSSALTELLHMNSVSYYPI